MSRRKPTSWDAIESSADQVITDVFSEVEEALSVYEVGPATEEAPAAPAPRRKGSEVLLLAVALGAIGLVGVLWFVLLAPKPQPQVATGPAPRSAVLQARAEAQVIAEYQRETDALAERLERTAPRAERDPFATAADLQIATAIPAFRPLPSVQALAALGPRRPPGIIPALRLPPAPPVLGSLPTPTGLPLVPAAPREVSLPVLPPPSVLSAPGAPAVVAAAPAPVINREPVLVGIVARDGGEPGAVIRTGEQFRDTSVGTVLRDGWTVAEIQTNRVILKRGAQRRTLELGGDS